MSRIQTLLYQDYKSITDIILLESSFAETDKGGVGIRQVYLGLSAHNLFLATDEVSSACRVDPSGGERIYKNLWDAMEAVRLKSMFPLDCVYLSVYRERSRNTIKLSFCKEYNRVRYFELGSCGGHEARATHWALWRDRIKTMTSCRYHDKRALHWMTSHFQRQTDCLTSQNQGQREFTSVQSETSVGTSVTRSLGTEVAAQKEVLCDLGHIHYLDTAMWRSLEWSSHQYVNAAYYRLVEDAVLLWESTPTSVNRKHSSRFKKCVPNAQFCYGFGLTQVNKREKHLLFVRKSKSCLHIEQEPREPEFQLTIGKSNLTTNISQFNLHRSIGESKSNPIFWTAQCLLNLSPRRVYHEAMQLRNVSVSSTRQDVPAGVSEKSKLNGLWRKFKKITKSKSESPTPLKPEQNDSPAVLHTCGDGGNRKPCERNDLTRVSDTKETDQINVSADDEDQQDFWREIEFPSFPTPSRIQLIKNNFKVARDKIPSDIVEFRIHHDINIYDCDIQQVATQLTLIESSLLSSIPAQELIILANEKSTLHTPQIKHMEAFSYRLSCLVVSEIVNTRESVPIRAKVLAKFILIAEACSKLHNYQSTCSILYALQSPPIFRLANTWSYVRKFHSRKYRTFNALCTALYDPVQTTYVHTIYEAISTHACFILPLRYILGTLVNRIPHGIGRVDRKPFYARRDITTPHQNDNYLLNQEPCHLNKTKNDSNIFINHSQGIVSEKPTLLASNYRNIAGAIDLLILGTSVVRLYEDTLNPNITFEYLTKRNYQDDWVNFALSKKLE